MKNKIDITKQIQEAILNGNSFYQDIPLPSPQTSGTYVQRSTYAWIRAQQVFSKHEVLLRGAENIIK